LIVKYVLMVLVENLGDVGL